MPDPQPAWAQQYNADMEPAWARKFEPPSIVSSESTGALQALMTLYAATGDDKYRTPIPRALAWFERSRLPEGRWARFYELKTNRPLYFTKDYQLVYTDDDVPTHYAFKSGANIDGLRKRYEQLDRERKQRADRGSPRPSPPLGPPSADLIRQTRRAIDTLDAKGRWIEDGMIDCRTFIRNVDTMARYLAHP